MQITEQKSNPSANLEAKSESSSANGNPYEVFREAIKATVHSTIVKVRDTSTSFNWSIGRVITACAEACKLPIVNTPDDFKRIVKFEINKLRDSIAFNESWELVRSREDFILTDGLMKGRLTNISHKLIPLEGQLTEARKLYSRLGNKMSDVNFSQEKRASIRKRMQKVLAVIDHTTAEIARQQKLIDEASQAETEVAPSNGNSETKS